VASRKEAYSSPGLLYSEVCANAWLQHLTSELPVNHQVPVMAISSSFPFRIP
jgi:hypothetical protein